MEYINFGKKQEDFFSQFDNEHQAKMLGHILFKNELLRRIGEYESHKDLPEHQYRTMVQAGALINVHTAINIDRLTEEYNMTAGSEDFGDKTVDELITLGYSEALSFYRKTAHDITESDTFTGRANGVAGSFYVGIGMELAGTLNKLVEIPGYLDKLLSQSGTETEVGSRR